MNNWFTVKVKYTKQLDNGTLKRVSEPYLLAAMTFTDAEARIYEELGAVIRGEFTVTGIARTEIHDIFTYDDEDVWYKCKVTYENIEVDGEKAKRVAQNFLVSAASVKQAYDRLKESLQGLMVDFGFPSIIISQSVEVFPWNEELDKEISRIPLAEGEEFETVASKELVFSASGIDSSDEDHFDESAESEVSEVEDSFDSED
jgi:hypothetical protein